MRRTISEVIWSIAGLAIISIGVMFLATAGFQVTAWSTQYLLAGLLFGIFGLTFAALGLQILLAAAFHVGVTQTHTTHENHR